VIVVDASAVAALAFAEPEGEKVVAAIGEESQLAAPRLLPFELANIARKKLVKRPDRVVVVAEQLRAALEIPVALHDVDHLAVLALATAHRLTAYDASYLWLARALGAALVTLDDDLRKAHQS
jgi:predicted nucleic acid-binding protein